MGFPKSVVGLGVLAAAAAANAGITGYEVNRYLVNDAGRTYSVLDVYADCTGTYDKIVNFFGQSTSGNNSIVRTILFGVANAPDASSATNGAPFAQSAGTGWMPTASSTPSWDSFVSMGARTQSNAAAQAMSGDPYFANAGTLGANTIQGGYSGANYVGAGWQTGLPNNASGADNFNMAGTYADKKLMLGRFTVDITGMNLVEGDLKLQFHGKITAKVNGTTYNGGSTTQPLIDQTWNYLVPTPGALALVGMAGLISRRRKA